MQALSLLGGRDKRGHDILRGPFLLRDVESGLSPRTVSQAQDKSHFLPLVFSVPREVKVSIKDSQGLKFCFKTLCFSDMTM